MRRRLRGCGSGRGAEVRGGKRDGGEGWDAGVGCKGYVGGVMGVWGGG